MNAAKLKAATGRLRRLDVGGSDVSVGAWARHLALAAATLQMPVPTLPAVPALPALPCPALQAPTGWPTLETSRPPLPGSRTGPAPTLWCTSWRGSSSQVGPGLLAVSASVLSRIDAARWLQLPICPSLNSPLTGLRLRRAPFLLRKTCSCPDLFALQRRCLARQLHAVQIRPRQVLPRQGQAACGLVAQHSIAMLARAYLA